MSTKIENLAKQAMENQKRAERLRDEVEKLKVQMDAYEAEAERAAESGDVDSYKKLKQKATDAGATLYVKQATIKKYTGPCSQEDALAAWSDFQREYDAAFNKALKEYDAEVKKQRERLKNIIKMQSRARDQRKVLATLAGMSDTAALDSFKFACVDGRTMGPDRVYYLSKKEITTEESAAYMNAFMCKSLM